MSANSLYYSQSEGLEEQTMQLKLIVFLFPGKETCLIREEMY